MNQKRIIRWIPALIWMIVIFTLSQQTGSELHTFLPLVQRLLPLVHDFNFGHFIAYFVLAILIWWAMANQRLSTAFIVVFLCILYGMTDEYHQSFIANRTPDILDIRNDMIGAILAMLVVRLPFICNRLLAK